MSDAAQGSQMDPSQGDYTEQDAEQMDRVAEAGVSGAFGANPDAEQERAQMREDAEDAFSGDDTSSTSGS
jgi:hypothetical protein